MNKSIFLRSFERLEWIDWREAHVLEEIVYENQRGIIVELVTPISAETYDKTNEIKKLILFPRHYGFTIDDYPSHVYICIPDDSNNRMEYQIIDWGLMNNAKSDWNG